MKMNKIITCLGIVILSASLIGCASAPQPKTTNPFTPGQVTMTLKKGVTTQADVLNAFGSPNIVTQDSTGDTIWTYQKYATVSQSSSGGFYATVLLIGGNHGDSQSSSSQNMMTLIITFDKNNVVSGFKSMYTSF